MQNSIKMIQNLDKGAKEIFRLLQRYGPLTKNELLQLIKTNLSKLNRMMQPLEDEQFITEIGIGESSGGRKPVLYDLNVKRFYVVGIDISRPYTEIALMNPKMTILAKRRFMMDETLTPANTGRKISVLLAEMLQELHIERQLVIGAGLGTVGPLDRKKGVMLNPINFDAPDWVGAPIKGLLEEALDLPVVIDNGANTAILAEFIFGEGKLYRNLAFFNCSVGIRTGAISDGIIVRSINDAEDAFGHMVIDVNGVLCDCGNYGCIECYASIHAIVQNFRTAIKKGRKTTIQKNMDELDYVDILRAAEADDDLAKEIICNAAVIFSAGLANYIKLLNPGLVILSGPLVSHSDMFYRTCIDSAIKRLSLKDAQPIVFSRGGRFGDDAISLGAGVMVIESLL